MNLILERARGSKVSGGGVKLILKGGGESLEGAKGVVVDWTQSTNRSNDYPSACCSSSKRWRDIKAAVEAVIGETAPCGFAVSLQVPAADLPAALALALAGILFLLPTFIAPPPPELCGALVYIVKRPQRTDRSAAVAGELVVAPDLVLLAEARPRESGNRRPRTRISRGTKAARKWLVRLKACPHDRASNDR
ncbi:hypothetical protein MAPG_07841 [Magnaporthiopsis poae ATCC 64411]|uniref:Uncharacterized protein n=1 Tax=Magnaporthiopsis poae (strain ATCC 64411 / 73-15) TaxID=644358 RepID=A0A0C4E5R8_MAGP6|nr:hypothetical protein MAPG_07841 [Magnaporthiopsis poae ATCC 64411]